MSSSGGGHVVLARQTLNWVSPDMSQSLALSNDTDTDTTITSEEAQALANEYLPDGGSITLTWNGSVWAPA